MPFDQGFTLDFSDETYRSLLVQAVKECDVQSYRVLLANGADPLLRFPLPDPDPDDGLHWYDSYDGYYDDYDTVRFVVTEEDTLLFLAAKSGCAEIVEHLLILGEDIDHRGGSRQTALEAWVFGEQSGREHCHWVRAGELLLEAGADPQANSGTVWKAASQKSDGQAKKVLLGWKAKKQRDQLFDRLQLSVPELTEDLPVKARGRL